MAMSHRRWIATAAIIGGLVVLFKTATFINNRESASLSSISTVKRRLSRISPKSDSLQKSFANPTSLPQETRDFLENIKTISITSSQKAAFKETVQKFDHFWRQTHKKPYFLYGGTLLGAYRHSGFVPWDDDFDVVINYDDVPFLINIRQSTSLFDVPPGVTQKGSYLIKLFLRDPNITTAVRKWRWPFIDVWTYKIKGETVQIPEYMGSSYFNKADVFPLTEMPFEDWRLPVPRCPLTVLHKAVSPSDYQHNCYASWYSHQKERGRAAGKKQIPCRFLRKIFPFTKWKRLNERQVEEWKESPNGTVTRGRAVLIPQKKPRDCV